MINKEELLKRNYQYRCLYGMDYYYKDLAEHSEGGKIYMYVHILDNKVVATGVAFGNYTDIDGVEQEETTFEKKYTLSELDQLEKLFSHE